MRLNKRSALALPFLIAIGALALSWCAVRLAVAPLGDSIARRLARAVPPAQSAAPPSSAAEAESELSGSVAPIPDPTDEQLESVGALPRRVASRSPVARRAVLDENAAAAAAGPDTVAAPAAPIGDTPKANIFVPAAVVARALERRDVAAVNALAPDGSQLGARLAGVGKYRTGLRDGDVVVFVGGTRTPTVKAMISAAMQSATNGAPRLSGRVLRGDTTIAVVLELPK
jgi:hypothetical protein